MILAAIDLGTNTFRLIVAETNTRNIKILLRDSKIVGLGKGFDPITKAISEGSINNALDVLKIFSNKLLNYPIDSLRVVATSAIREASNSNQFITPAQSIISHKIDIITGEEEAEITVLGVLNSIDYKGNKLIVDIGGGSTEIIYVNSYNKLLFLESTNLGVIKYSNMYDFSKKLTKDELNIISRDIDNKVKHHCKSLNFRKTEDFELIVTAGTPTTLASIDLKITKYNHDLVNNHILSKKTIIRILNNLIEMDCNKRLKIPGMYAGRENSIIPGTLIILSLLDNFNKNKIIISDQGLLEGLIYDIINLGKDTPFKQLLN